MAFLERLLRRRTPLSNITGFAGGNLQDQLDTDNQNAPLSTTPVNESINRQELPMRPTTTMADQYMATAQPVDDGRQRQVNPFQQRLLQGGSRPRITDPVGFDSEHLRDLESQKDPRWEKILNAAAAGVASAAQGGAPIKPIPTRRERDIGVIEGRLGRDVALDKQRILREQGQMVPYTLPDGTTTMVPAKSVGTLAVRATGDAGRLAETRRRNDAYIGHLNDLPKEKQAEAARKLYSSGIADGNAELKAELARRMGLPATEALPDSDKGTVQTDAQGNFIIVHPRSGEAKPVTQQIAPPQPPAINPDEATRPRTATAPVKSFKATQEAGKDERSRLGRAAAMERALVMARVQGARMGDPTEYEDMATQAEKDAADAEAQAKEVGPRKAAPYLAEASRARARVAHLKELATKARGGQGGSAPSNSNGSFDLSGWRKAHPDATEQQINAMRSKAKARNLSIIE